jgi:hypothetical protein
MSSVAQVLTSGDLGVVAMLEFLRSPAAAFRQDA